MRVELTRRARRAVLALLLVGLVLAPAASASETVYDQLRAQRLDGRRIAVRDLVLQRDVFTFRLDGEVHFLAPAEGRDYCAVFVGQGSFELAPATDDERAHLRLIGKADGGKLTDRFDSLVLYFSDDTARELLSSRTSATAAWYGSSP